MKKKLNSTMTCNFYRQYYWGNVSVGIFQRPWELFFFSLIFKVFITYRYIDEMCLSIYPKNYKNYSSSFWYCLQCLLYISMLMECVYQYILKNMRIVSLINVLLIIVFYKQNHWWIEKSSVIFEGFLKKKLLN
jgi:hypothetical protein